jgi:hypothetical protein
MRINACCHFGDDQLDVESRIIYIRDPSFDGRYSQLVSVFTIM